MNLNYLSKFLLFVVTLSFYGCFTMENKYASVAPGYWRGVLQISPKEIIMDENGDPPLGQKLDEVSEGELPFIFEIKYKQDDQLAIEIINGEERIVLEEVVIGHNIRTGKDSIRIEFPVFDSYLVANYEGNIMDGFWVVNNRENYRIPFRAKQGQNHRFTSLRKKPIMDLTGQWETTFDLEEEVPYKAIGELKQNGNHLSGTFRTETGDYRFLEGTVQKDKLYISVFDGAHAFLFEGKILPDSSIIGSFRSGKHYKTTWKAHRNPNFELASPDALTFLKEGYDKVDFSFENAEGQMVSLSDPKYDNKIKIVQIFGTWCPNCRDETQFLTEYLQKNKPKDLEIIALAFEKHKDKKRAMNTIRTYKEKMGIPYEILLAGHSNKKEAANALPMLNHILSYPTMIFIDKENKVRRIHTGFNGPATSLYADFVKDFDQFLRSLYQAAEVN